jgi:hypothetical protein
MFLDERGTGLRVTWHPERDLVVLSVWQGDGCVGTFRMSVQDIPRLSGLLAAALGDWVDQTGGAPGPGGPGPGGPGSSGPRPGSGGPGSRTPRPAPGGLGPGGLGPGGLGPGGLGRGGLGPGSGAFGYAVGSTITGEWDLGGPGTAGSGPRAEGGPGAGLSVQRRIRLSRPVLKLRGIQDRRRRAE